MKKFFGILASAALGGMIALSVHYYIFTPVQGVKPGLPQTQVKYVNMPGGSAPVDFVSAAENTVHAVVHVKTTYKSEPMSSNGYDPFRDFFWGFPQHQGPQVSSGSGVIISADGYIVTNNHVVEKGDQIEVTLNDKRTFTAEVVGTDPSTDLALLKIKENNLPYLVYGNSDDVKIGEWVLAVGNPFNLTSTVTAGIVSAKGRNINILGASTGGPSPIESFIQTDAAVNPGNSGGALVSSSGQLIGINTAIASNTGSYSGYSFAVPVNIVKKVVNDLLEFGTVQRAFLGVSISDIDSKLAKEKEFSDLKGVYVGGVTEGGSAEEAGIKPGDVITKVGSIEVNNTSSLLEQIGKFRPNDKVVITVKRGSKEMNIPVVLKNKNGENKLVSKDSEDTIQLLGGLFEPVSKEEMNKLGLTNGLKVTSLDAGKLRSAGIKEGFIITSIDKKKISTKEDLKSALENKKGGVLIEGVYPNGMKAYYAFGI
ncbi:MAG: Do family serine endopeptidase [Bacteroidota bacterium]